MALNLDAIKNRLSQLQNTTTKQSRLWRPQPGKNLIRIVPYKFNRENPFMEMHFHYGMTDADGRQRSYLSPISFGRPDPIEEFSTKLKNTGNKEDYQLGKKLEAKLRTFVPVIVRGEENEGVKFWGFGKTVYQELLGFISDPDYGDISDPTNGRDVVVEFHTAEETGKSFPSTTIRVKPNVTPVSDNKEVISLIGESQVEITEIYTEQSYDDLKTVLSTYLNPEGGEETTTSSTETSDEDKSESAVVSENRKTATEAADAFDTLFNN